MWHYLWQICVETQSQAGPSAKRRRSPQSPQTDHSDLLRMIGAALTKKVAARPEDDAVTATLKIHEVKLRQVPPELLASLEHEILNVM